MTNFILNAYYRIKRSPSGWPKGKSVHFVVPHLLWASAMTRGHQISRQLNANGIRSRVFSLDRDFEEIQQIKNSFVVFIKIAFQHNQKLLSQLRDNGNYLIWDPIDGLVDLKDDPDIVLFNGVIVANKECQKFITPYLKEDCLCHVIYHHWDPRVKPNRAKDYQLVYLGDPSPENISEEHIKHIHELQIAKCSSVKMFKKNNLLAEVLKYNCHFSVRKEGSHSFKYKPNAKLSFASAADANIILSRDNSHVELLDTSYPYYTSSDLESVKKTVQYSQETFGTSIWYDALAMIRRVKERTSLKRIAEDYIDFFKKFLQTAP